MSTVIAKCPACDSENITILNPEVKNEVQKILCTLKCECHDCNVDFTIKSYTKYGKGKRIYIK